MNTGNTEYISATEASHRYHISDKTIRKWIKHGHLEAEKRAVHGLQQYFIVPAEIERYIAERQLSEQSNLAERLAELEKEVRELRDRVAVLEQSEATTGVAEPAEHVDKPVAKARATRSSKPPRALVMKEQRPAKAIRSSEPSVVPVVKEQLTKTQAVRASQPSEVPAGSITLAQLATELGISRTTFLGHVKTKDLEHIAVPKRNRPGEFERYFTPEQVQSVKEWHTGTKR
jgi:hypothetical protein